MDINSAHVETDHLVWLDIKNAGAIPKSTLSWIIDDQSLTEKLRYKYHDFSLNIVSQSSGKPHKNEALILQDNSWMTIREVELLGNGGVVVFARSIIPNTDDTKGLLAIGSKPLGELLFNDPNVKRGELQITHTGHIWGRRSLFTIGKTKLLVSEFFLQNLYA